MNQSRRSLTRGRDNSTSLNDSASASEQAVGSSSMEVDDDTRFKYGQVVWVNTGAGYPTWPARIDFIPMQMNPEFKAGGIFQYPIFCFGTHNLMWLQQDLIFENSAQNYSKYLKKGRSYSKKDQDLSKGFDVAMNELEESPSVKSDIETLEDLDDFLAGNMKLDISNWIDAGLINMACLKKSDETPTKVKPTT